MRIIVIFVVLFMSLIFAQEMSLAKIVKLSNKGEKIVKTLCESDKLPNAEGTIKQLMEKIKNSHACPSLPKSKLEAVAYYVSNGSMKFSSRHITVPPKAKCPVCGMFVGKYPKWVGLIVVDGKKYYFDGAKDLMKFYFYVSRSEVYGPLGNELIPFKTSKAAKNFLNDHGGSNIVLFENITPKMVMALDGVEYEE